MLADVVMLWQVYVFCDVWHVDYQEFVCCQYLQVSMFQEN